VKNHGKNFAFSDNKFFLRKLSGESTNTHINATSQKEFMQEKVLTKLCIVTSLIGLLVLFFYTSSFTFDPVTSIENIPKGDTITIKGIVGKINQQNTVAFIEVDNEVIEHTPVILFKDKDITLKEGNYVEITGTIEEFEGKKEMIGNKVVLIE
jgi:DNA/RNA endonuclease YhcR with UshA esterase domain